MTPDAARRIRAGHPWVFDRSVTDVRPQGKAGDLAVIFDRDRSFLAIGLYDPSSPIAVRILHHGRPTPIDDDWFRSRLSDALARRAPLRSAGDTDAYRWVHGENDGLGGLVVDRYGEVVVVKIYTAAWSGHLGVIEELIGELVAPEAIVMRSSRLVGRAPEVVRGKIGGPVPYRENGLRMEADVIRGQKTGAFLDQRDNRRALAARARSARVLDVFCCTGGFSVHAAAGGAREVHSVDQSPGAVATVGRVMAANADRPEVAAAKWRATVGDAFEVMAGLADRGERYDVVVVDPPSFASRRDQVEGAMAAYARLTSLALELLVPGGTLLQASCSSRVGADRFVDAVVERARDAGRPLADVEVTGHPLDHPVGFAEGAYLKAVLALVP